MKPIICSAGHSGAPPKMASPESIALGRRKLECATPFGELAVGKDDHTGECHTGYSHEPEIAVDKELRWPMAVYPSFIRRDAADRSNTGSRQIKRCLAAAVTDAPGSDSIVTLPLRPKKQEPKPILNHKTPLS